MILQARCIYGFFVLRITFYCTFLFFMRGRLRIENKIIDNKKSLWELDRIFLKIENNRIKEI